jgi:hypothetical protein
MTKVIVHEDCGNSPKNLFVQKMIIAIAKGDARFMLKHVSDDIRWNIVGGRVFQGKEEVARVLEGIDVAELNIRHIATHGKAGAADGTLKLTDGRTQAFCDVFEFTNSKGDGVKEITTYVIGIK